MFLIFENLVGLIDIKKFLTYFRSYMAQCKLILRFWAFKVVVSNRPKARGEGTRARHRMLTIRRLTNWRAGHRLNATIPSFS